MSLALFSLLACLVIIGLLLWFLIDFIPFLQDTRDGLVNLYRSFRARRRRTHYIELTEPLRIAVINGLLQPEMEMLVCPEWSLPGSAGQPTRLPTLTPEEARVPHGTRLRVETIHRNSFEVRIAPPAAITSEAADQE